MNKYDEIFKDSKFFILFFLAIIFNISWLEAGGSPIQPEFANFESVSTDNMVSEFDGSFLYNLPILTVPGPNGSGYSITLSYHSGICPESDASWVGYGWTLNPGSIIRNTKGYPDDYYDTEITFWNKVEPNTTIALGINGNLEFFSNDVVVAQLSAGATIKYNNYRGFYIGANLGFDYAGYLNLNFGATSTGLSTVAFSHFGHPTRLLSDLCGLGLDKLRESSLIFKNDFGLQNELSNLTSKSKFLSDVVKNINPINNTISEYAKHLSQKALNSFGIFNSDGIPPLQKSSYTGINISGEIKADAMLAPMTGAEGGYSVNYSQQSTKISEEKKANGFLYSGNATRQHLMDYSVEKDSDYHNKKKFMGIPIGNPDYYTVSGEGVSGSFRVYNKKIGQFYPRTEESKTEFYGLGFAIDVGPGGIGYGGKLSGGSNEYNFKDWNIFIPSNSLDYEPQNSLNNNNNSKDEPVFFRFINDFASNIDFSKVGFVDDHNLVSLNFNPETLPYDSYVKQLNQNKRSARSAFISYNTFEDFEYEYTQNSELITDPLNSDYGSLFPRMAAYNKTNPILSDFYIDNYYFKMLKFIDQPSLNKQILEFSITNNDGANYTYGLPVFSRNEADLNYGPSGNNIYNNKSQIAFGATPLIADKVVGQERNAPYVSMYLLTSISTPDYVDVKQDGFTSNDLGAYTLFGYNRTAGTDWKTGISTKNWWHSQKPILYDLWWPIQLGPSAYEDKTEWYRWRTPYNGFNYNKNSLSDPNDDLATFSKGERENYYLQKIETKTHIAYFITNTDEIAINLNGTTVYLSGTNEERHDAWEAGLIEFDNARNKEQDLGSANLGYSNKMRKLERIELYVKSENYDNNGGILTKKLQTTFFEYDYSLMEYIHSIDAVLGDDNVPNSEKIGSGNDHYGKLTLKKVWTEYEDVSEDKISPYIFSYEYKSRNYPSVGNFLEYANYHSRNGGADDLKQNPAYNPNNVDRWGNYQDDDGDESSRKLKYNDWVDQTPAIDFDPAAWHLKEIGLPSGGEIHVYYEENDYSYVQNRRAMVMTSINNYLQDDQGETSFVINCEDLGYNPNEINELILLMKSHFLGNYNIGTTTFTGKNEKLYFKFLFSLTGNNVNLDNCKSEYIDGFIVANDIIPITSNGITTGIKITCKQNSIRNLCEDFYLTNRTGKVTPNGNNCNPEYRNYNNQKDIIDYANGLLNSALSIMEMLTPLNLMSYCSTVDVAGNSYIRIPTLKAKKGGGVRVKSIIMYDRFNECIENSSKSIAYGKEYLYQLKEGGSSGVAANEPQKGYEENALHNYIKTIDSEDWLTNYMEGNFMLAGEMKEEFSSPIGESLLPSPQIGYSRIVIKNIFEGMSDEGFTVKEFYTTKDYPFDKNYLLKPDQIVQNGKDNVNGVEYSNISRKDDKWKIFPGPVVKIQDMQIKLSQGYQFIQNRMNGQLKSEYSMGGSLDNNNLYNSSYSKYEYFEPCEQIPVYYDLNNIKMEFLGREIEFFQEARDINESFINATGEFDFIFVYPFFPLGSLSGGVNNINNGMKSHVTTKVIRYPAILKSITSMKDGITVKTENVAFDRHTGQAVITRTTDEFNGMDLAGIGIPDNDHDGSYYGYKFVAANEYESMSHKSDNEKQIIKSDRYKIVFNKIFEGQIHYLDVIINKSGGECINLKDIFNEGDLIYVNKTAGYFHISSIQDNRVILEPIFRTLVPNQSFNQVDINIIRSGKTNQLSTVAGNLVTYGQADENNIINGIIFPHLPNTVPFATGSEPYLEIIRRQNFINQLNTKITEAKQFGLVEFEYNDPELKIKSKDGTCQPIENINITIKYIDPQIEFCVDNTSNTIEDSIDYNPPLVSDLNDLLNNVWNKNLYLNLRQNKEWMECTDCESFNGDTVSFQKYWTTHSNKDRNLFEKSMDLIGYKKIQETYYNILDSMVLGSSIINNTLNQCFEGIDYDTYFYNVNTADTTLFTGRMNLFINGHTLEIIRQTDPYPVICQDSSYTIDSLTLDTLYNSLEDCVRFDCKNFNMIGCTLNSDRPFWDSYLVLPFMDHSHRFITIPPDSNLPEKNNPLMYDYMDLDQKFTERWGYFYCDTANGWLYYKPIDSNLYNNLEPIAIMQLNIHKPPVTNELCCFKFVPLLSPNPISHFKLDEDNGYQVEIDPATVGPGSYNECTKLCFEFCPDIYPNMTIDGVIKADAVTYSDDWKNDLLPPSSNNSYMSGNKGKWRVDDSYLYKTNIIIGGNDVAYSTSRIYLNSGVYENFENIFNWKYKEGNYAWLFVNSIDKYSVHGSVIETSDILDIKSSQLYGYKNTLPIMVANNTPLNFIGFESFEDKSGTQISGSKSHSGFKSYGIPQSGTSESIFDMLIFDDQVIREGFTIKAWFKTEYDPYNEIDDRNDHLSANIYIYAGSNYRDDFSSDFIFKAQTGEWSLYEIKVLPNQLTTASIGNSCAILLSNSRTLSDTVWVDDIKVTPAKSQSNCYVYNRNDFKPLASFDDQHYALMYQYNSKGDLIRKQIETERGIKTIAEAQYNTPKIDRGVTTLDCSTNIPMIEKKSSDKNNIKTDILPKITKKYSINKTDLLADDSLAQGTIKQDILDINITPENNSIKFFDNSPDLLLQDSVTKGGILNKFDPLLRFEEIQNEIQQDSLLTNPLKSKSGVLADSLDYLNIQHISDTLSGNNSSLLDSANQNNIKNNLNRKLKKDKLKKQLKKDMEKFREKSINSELKKDIRIKSK
ncbi:MAG: hypothetical protein RO257_14675 [Candidatus Kapabacteria bacterium]|nr:hypothetical protein [Candidatus Kapabacteria bacterium]